MITANKNGFGLVEVMIVGAILAIIALGMSTLMSDMARESGMARSKMGALSLASDTKTTLRVENVCKAAFTNFALTNDLITSDSAKMMIGSSTPLKFGNMPSLASATDIAEYNVRLSELYLDNALDADALTGGRHHYLVDLVAVPASITKNKQGQPIRTFQKVIIAKIRFLVDSSNRVLDCSLGDSMGGAACAPVLLKTYPWARQTIICDTPNGGKRPLTLSLLQGGALIYSDFQTSNPVRITFRAATGEFDGISNGEDIGPDCQTNLKDILDNHNNKCDDE